MKRLQIAINTRHWIPGKMEGIGRYVMNLAGHISKMHPEADFHFIFDRRILFETDFPKNVKIYSVFPPARHVYLFPYWYNIAVPRLLKKIKADIFLSLDNMNSLNPPCPSITAIHDINFEHFPEDLPSVVAKYYRKNTAKFISKAEKVLTVSEFSKEDIEKAYNTAQKKIDVVYNGLSQVFHPQTDEDKLKTRNAYSGGRPYFLVLGSINPRKNIKRTIEAYTEFRKRSTEDITLVISGRPMWSNVDLDSLIEKNPFKGDILFTGYLSDKELGQIVGAANSLLYLSYFEGFGVPVIEAFASGVPVIAGNKSALPETCGGAALLSDPFDISDMASAMEKLQSDETLRKDLIAKGLVRAKNFSWEKSAEKLWKVILDVLENK